MTLLPIVARELRVASRARSTYQVRLWAVVVALSVLGFMLIRGARVRAPGFTAAGEAFGFLTALAMVYCFFEGLRSTSDCLSAERREGTLGLLFLTDLSGYDVVLGKLAAASLGSFYALLAILPVMAIPLLAGGVTGGEFARVSLVLVNTLAFSLAMGLWISARGQDAYKTAIATVLVLAAIAGLPPLLDQLFLGNRMSPARTFCSVISPAFNCVMAFDSSYRLARGRYWLSLVLVHGATWLLVLTAGRYVLRHWREGPIVAPDWPRPRRQHSPAQASRKSRLILKRQWLEENPAIWLGAHFQGTNQWVRLPAWLAVAVVAWQSVLPSSANPSQANPVPQALAMLLMLLTTVLFYLIMAARAARCLVESRANGTLELLLCTPLSARRLVQGMQIALRPLLWCLTLVLVAVRACTIYTVWFWQAHMMTQSGVRFPEGYLENQVVSSVFYALVFFFDLYALGWMAPWLALKARNLNQTVARALLYVIIVPWFVCFLLRFNVPVYIGRFDLAAIAVMPFFLILKDVVFANYAWQRLAGRFRQQVAEGQETAMPRAVVSGS